MTDLYKVLGLEKGASDKKIRSAYRSKMVSEHPDKHGNSAASQKKFREIIHAYETLKDPQKKSLYDALGVFQNAESTGRGPQFEKKSPEELMNLWVVIALDLATHSFKHGIIKNALLIVAGSTLLITSWGVWSILINIAIGASLYKGYRSWKKPFNAIHAMTTKKNSTV